MSLLLRFQGGFGVDSYSQDTIITVPQDVAEKSGLFVADYVVNVKVPLGSMNRFLHVTCDETGNPLGDWYFDVPAVLAEWANANYPLNWELAVTNCQLNYPLNWELGLASDLTDVELAEQVRLDELYVARLAALEQAEQARLVELYEAMRLDALAEEAYWAEMQLPGATWAEEVRLAELAEENHWVENLVAEATWAEEARLAALELDATKREEEVRVDEWNSEFNPLRWDDEACVAKWVEEARLAEMQLELAVKDHLLEMQLAEAKWAEETSAAEWAEEARLAACSSEGAPFSWNYDVH